MGKTTGIEWCDGTWNPWRGCRRVSAGCAHCYALRDLKRWKLGTEVVRQQTFDDPLRWARNATLAVGSTIFTCSWSDFFIPEADEMRPEAWRIMRACPGFFFLILTKRPERIEDHLPADWEAGYPNVGLGVTVENQAAADERLPILLDHGARVRFVSAEPLLGPVNLMKWVDLLDWVICGGETGPKARTMEPPWVTALRDQCGYVGVPFFFKKWGEHPPADPSTGAKLWPKNHGCMLEGRVWQERPQWYGAGGSPC